MQTPESLTALLTQAVENHKLGKLDAARDFYKQALATTPDHFHANRLLGALLVQQERHTDAKPYLEKALEIQPENLEVLNNLGIIFRSEKKYDDAETYFKKVLAIKPDHSEALRNLALTYWLSKENLNEAEKIYRLILEHNPTDAEATTFLAHVLLLLNNLKEALHFLDKAISLSGETIYTLRLSGGLCIAHGDYNLAARYYKKALELDPNNPEVCVSIAHIFLALGEWGNGWKEYEKRIDVGLVGVTDARLMKKTWDGTPKLGKKLLIWLEQGFGDTLQFIRYAPLCKQFFSEVYIYVDPRYRSLFSILQHFPDIDGIVENLDGFVFDETVALLSLPHIFKIDPEKLPQQAPYLSISTEARGKWQGKIDHSRPCIGLVWSGRPAEGLASVFACRRNMRLEDIQPILNIDANFYCLQIEKEAQKSAEDLGVADRITFFNGQIDDFMDTAAIIEQLDLVICVDTSVAHLAGALGKPVWIMSRFDACWRWLRNRETSPWYPTARIFGQPSFGDWKSVVVNVERNLRHFVAQREY